jgi:L-galactose dehydrogenase
MMVTARETLSPRPAPHPAPLCETRLGRVNLGRTGLTTSVMGLGAGGASRLGGPRNGDLASVRLVRTALDHGVDFIDTAEAYGTEEVIGAALKGFGRDRVVLSTKKRVSADLDRAVEPGDVVRSLEASLRRLATDHVDVYHLHGVRPEQYVALRDRLLPTLLRLKEQGKVRFLGITEAFAHDPAHRMLEEALDDDVWDVVMVGYNLLNQSARRIVLPRALARNVGVLVMCAARGSLSHPERLRDRLGDLSRRCRIMPHLVDDAMRFVAAEGPTSSLQDAAYRFCRDTVRDAVILSGTGNEEHLVENIRSLSKAPLPRRYRERLAALFDGVDEIAGT